MAKPSSSHAEPAPEPDPDQMAADTLMTSVFTGICLLVATVVLAAFGSAALAIGRSMAGTTGAKVGLAVGLLVGAAIIGWVLRHFAASIRNRSANLYRGAWIGSIASLVIIMLMAFAPQVAFPQYCPPGQICTNGRR